MTWFDAHNHLQDARLGDPHEVAREMRVAGVGCAIVNATRQSDWNAVHKLIAWSMGEEVPELLPAYGIHPWQAHTAGEGWLDDLQDYLVTHPNASIGEIGLDGWVDEPTLEVQRPVFAAQLELAQKMRKTATIHCLKAWGPLMDELKACPPTAPFLMHSYGGSIELARELIEMGAFFSFSGHFLQPRKAKVVEVFKQLPQDRILIETDAPDMAPPGEIVSHPLEDGVNHPANLAAIGEVLAKELGMRPEALAELTTGNAKHCFGVQNAKHCFGV